MGVLPDARLNPLYGLFPNPLVLWETPFFTQSFVAGLALLSLCFAVGLWRRWIAVLLWFGWAALFNRNNLISNPSLPYVGVMLLFCAMIPEGEPFSFSRRKKDWFFPSAAYGGAWLLMAAGYTFSGLIKLQSPSWVDGTAFVHLLNNPLARPGLFRDLFLSFPEGLHVLLTWGALLGEIIFLPMSLFRAGRIAAWTGMTAMHLGIVLVVDFTDLTLGMMMLHLFTFDSGWLPLGWRPVWLR
jgi:hypothetical protein